MLADLRWLGLDWDEGPDKEGKVGVHIYYARINNHNISHELTTGVILVHTGTRKDYTAVM